MDERITVDQYGRRKWDVEAYKTPQPIKKQKTVEKISNKSKNQLLHKSKLLSSSINAINKHTLVSGKERIGFKCDVCDWKFKDTMALVNHFNSPYHLGKVTNLQDDDDEAEEMLDGVRRATIEEVQRTMDGLLNRDHPDNKTMKERIELRKSLELKNRQKKKKHASGSGSG